MEQQAFLYLLPLFLSFVLFLNKTRRKNKFPPGPYRLPLLGHLHLLDFNKLHHSLLNLANKHGPLMLLQLGSFPTAVVSSRNIAENIFTAHDLTFSNRPTLTAMTKILYNNSSISFAPNPDQWRQARKIAITELLSPRRVRSFQSVRAEEVKKLVTYIKEIRDLSLVNLSQLSLSLVNNIVCRATLGDEFGDGGYGGREGVWLHQLLSETQGLVAGFCAADYFPWMRWADRLMGFHERLEKNFAEMDRLFDRVIGEHLIRKGEKEENKEKDLLHVLLNLHQVEKLQGGFLSNIDHVKAILVVS